MKFRIPFTIASADKLKKHSRLFVMKATSKRSIGSLKRLQKYLENSNTGYNASEYKAVVRRSTLIYFISSYILLAIGLFLFRIGSFFMLAFGLAILFSLFIYFSQSAYPKVFDNRRVRDIEKNLLPSLQDIVVQLNSGIPLFNILVNISSSNYGELSNEMKKAVKKINAGYPQIEVLEELGEKNSSSYFRRTLWQVSNGMRAGSDISVVIKENIKFLNEEQILQIQNYGNKLNPVIMFYLLVSIILPSLSITFLTIISSMLGLESSATTGLFVALFVAVTLIQAMFLGVVRSLSPRLM